MERGGNRYESVKNLVATIVAILVFVGWIAAWVWQERQYEKTIAALTSITPKQVTMFRIHSPRGGYVEFKAPDPLITEFFQALTDHRPYSYSHDRVREDHQWFFEVIAGKVFIQISFHIPYGNNDNIVAGGLGKFTKNGSTHYGYFQSRKLFQWYQKYKDRWLTPSAPPQNTE